MATQPVELHPDDVDPSASELQQEGQGAAQNAPAPLQNATRDLNVQYTKPTSGQQSSIAQPAGYKQVADVPHNDPRTVEVDDQGLFDEHAGGVVPHELYHVWSNNLPPQLKARIPTSKSFGDYGEPTVDQVNQWRSQGKTLLDIPSEKAAEMMRWASENRNDPQVQRAVKPYLDDMRGTPLSTVDATAPTDKQINTHPRAPIGPRDDIPGMEGLSAPAPSPKPMQRLQANDKIERMSEPIAPMQKLKNPYMAQDKPKGLVEQGNLPIWNRPSVKNADGSHSSELSISKGDDDGHEVLVPTIVDGKFLTPDGKMPPLPPDGKYPHPDDKNAPPEWKALWNEAWKHYEQTGEHLGKFDNADDADAYANVLHNRGSGQSGNHFVRPGDGSKLSTNDAQNYIVKAKGNKDIARAMAKHDGHTF
jgi:hypothetical protein